jgi:hypothetical protein
VENKPLQAFFNGAFDMLVAAFTASRELSASSKGVSREHAARELLRSLLPTVARVESGDIIDSFGNQSGQLDAVCVDHRSPTLRLGGSETGLILAEGALAVLEIKSSLSKQWDEVLRTYAAVAPMRPRVRLPPRRKPGSRSAEIFKSLDERETKRAERERAIPFIVIAGESWKTKGAIGQRCIELKRHATAAGASKVLIVALNPAAVALAEGDEVVSLDVTNPDHRGDVLAELWYHLVQQARWHSRARRRQLKLERYFTATAPLQPAPATTQPEAVAQPVVAPPVAQDATKKPE